MSNYFLFARPTFWEGMARVFDLGCTMNEYNYSSTPEHADFYAVHSDWKTVGSDILKAMATHADQVNSHSKE
jgi:hypothetical protein